MHALIDHLLLGADANGEPSVQSLRLANRHGLIAGATGTGKTVTLQRLAEQFSDAGVAVFAAMTMLAPSWAARRAMALPMPREDPVITATLPVRSNSSIAFPLSFAGLFAARL